MHADRGEQHGTKVCAAETLVPALTGVDGLDVGPAELPCIPHHIRVAAKFEEDIVILNVLHEATDRQTDRQTLVTMHGSVQDGVAKSGQWQTHHPTTHT